MTFPSILFAGVERRPRSEALAPPVFFADLNLDQIVAAVIAGKEEYNLAPFFYAALHDVEAVLYRHEVMRDLEDAGLLGHINAFAQTLRSMRDTLKQAEARHYRRQKEALFLDAVDAYCGAVAVLTRDLAVRTCAPAVSWPSVTTWPATQARTVSPRSWRRPRG